MYPNTEEPYACGQCPDHIYLCPPKATKVYSNLNRGKMFSRTTVVLLFLLLQCCSLVCSDSSDLSFKVINPPYLGCEREVKEGDSVHVHFRGELRDGTEFENTYAEDSTYNFIVGSKKVPVGMSQGVMGMCPGEIRELSVPPHLGFGEKGKDTIPGGAWLLYEVELLQVSDQGTDLFDELDVDQNEELTLEELKKYYSLPEVSKAFGMDLMSPDEEGISFLTQTLMNLGDTNSDDVIVRDEFYALSDLQKLQSMESAETELEFREDL